MKSIIEKHIHPEATGLAFIAGFFLSFRVILVLLSVDVLGLAPREGAALVLVLGLVLLALTCFHSLGFPARTFASILRLPSIRWVVLFLAFSFCSLAWSATVSPAASVAYWCGMAGDVAIIVILLRSGSVRGISHALLKGFIASTCLLALIAWFMPAQPDLRLGNEEYFNTNQIGNLCAMAIFLAQCLVRRKDGHWGLTIAFLALTLLRSLSKSTIIAFLLSQALLMILDKSISRRAKLLLAMAVVLAIVLFWGLFEAYYTIYTTTGNQAVTLTGRTGIWLYVLNGAFEQPWIGHGFDAMWKIIPPFGPDRFEARHGENELLTQFYAYGIVGVCMLMGLYGSLYRQIRKLPRSPLRMVLLSLLLFILIRGLAEAEPFDLLLPLWVIVLFSLMVEDAALGNRPNAMTATPVAPRLNPARAGSPEIVITL
jgi:exopolysaccharide production protein ExoQ